MQSCELHAIGTGGGGAITPLLRDAKSIAKAAVQLRKIARSLSPDGHGYGSADVAPEPFAAQGHAVQLAGGKFLIDSVDPYWVLAVEGDYDAALVYSCKNDAATGAIADQALFVISRTPTLAPAVLHRFLTLAASYAISSDCDYPFVLTVHRGGSYGLPPVPAPAPTPIEMG